jgi:asparagine synthase (glutamine-hydrolysing)
MCGISSIFGLRERQHNSQPMLAMLQALLHRGPDAGCCQPFFASDGEGYRPGRRLDVQADLTQAGMANVWMGHRRLSILDLSEAGLQPMQRGSLSITFNGEIFNYLELREQLASLGVSFSTNTDTEVLLAAYDVWGEECLNRLNGMYGFVIFNAANGEIFAARDPFGIKPLYYSYTTSALLFASEIKAFFASGLVSPTWDQRNAFAYLSCAMSVAPHGQTFFQHVHQVPAGHFLRANTKTGELRLARYYEPGPIEPRHDLQQALEEGRGLIHSACQMRLRSDRKIGVCLSSGIDSMNVTAALLEQKALPECYSIDAASAAELNEMPHIQEFCQKMGTVTHPLTMPKEVAPEAIVRWLLHNDEPVLFWGAFNQFLLYQKMKENNVVVTMSGHGGDELFCGYQRYYPAVVRQMHQARSWGTMFGWGVRHLPHLFRDREAIARDWKTYASADGWMEQYAAEHALMPYRCDPREAMRHVQACVGAANWPEQQEKSLFHYELQYLLRDADRNSMAHGLEERVPLLDTRLHAFSRSLPIHFLCHNGYLKGFARHLFPRIPVSSRLNLKKRGLYTDISPQIQRVKEYMYPLLKKSEILEQLVDVRRLPENLPGIVWWRLLNLTVLEWGHNQAIRQHMWQDRVGDDGLLEMMRSHQQHGSAGRSSVEDVIERVDTAGLSYIGREGLLDLHNAVVDLENRAVPGALIECGCALGGSSIILAHAKAKARALFVYDVFGMIPPPGEEDGQKAQDRYMVIQSGESEGLNGKEYYGYVPGLIERVRASFEGFDFSPDENNVEFIQGLYEETLDIKQPVALAHIDCDWYDSVKFCLAMIVPHLVVGGILVIDDYHYYDGCKKAVDEYFAGQLDKFSFVNRSRLHIVRIL